MYSALKETHHAFIFFLLDADGNRSGKRKMGEKRTNLSQFRILS